ncbi:hypothetical protein IFM89_021973 [Coptis chinensis]|uniref:Bifunctional inhibitor/plant lipid transfer protein/seed storage helical domain-containing protein n=1 Tax=Coptis chinensis TaxID=261450 RepID=A0A835I6T7_9MAGN|nr:hypothetical protein IFM89_021973 [Coptis chinensis]
MVKASLIYCVMALWCVLSVKCATKTAPAPTQECATVILTMADCLSFVTSGSTVKKPEGGCCTGLKTVLKTAPDCLCQTFKSSGQLGIALDMQKAMTLPSACGVKAPPSIATCNLSVAPGASPGELFLPFSCLSMLWLENWFVCNYIA